MAPEILRYEKYDAKADLWSVGAVLYEMAVGKAPFRAQNHIELLKKIEHSRGIKFPDEDPGSLAGKSGGGGSAELPVPVDIKALIRALLKRNPAERASFEDFFTSTALAKSKFPRPQESLPGPPGSSSTAWNGRPPTPEHHKVIPPEVLDPNAMIPPSKFNFRRISNVEEGNLTLQAINATATRHRSVFSSCSYLTSSKSLPSPRTHTRPLSQHGKPATPDRQGSRGSAVDGSLIPGETEEDGNLRREYVLVGDTRAVEFTKAADGKAPSTSALHLSHIYHYCVEIQPRRPLHDRRAPSTFDYTNEYPLAPLTDITGEYSEPLSNGVAITFPPPQHAVPPPLSSSPSSMASRAASNALGRALSIAKKNLFWHSSSGRSRGSPSSDPTSTSAPSSPRRPQIIPLDADVERDPLEDELLASLEELAQKTDVLTHWADEMYEYVKAIPQSMFLFDIS